MARRADRATLSASHVGLPVAVKPFAVAMAAAIAVAIGAWLHYHGQMPRPSLKLTLLALSMAGAMPAGYAKNQPESPTPASRSLDGTTRREASTTARRIALVIGNGNYASSPLKNPPHDADLIAGTLRGLGFEVILQKNADQRTMKRAIQNFGSALEASGGDAVGLFYYAGHGVQLSGRNYLIPVAANIERDADVEIEAVSADWVIEQMRYARNRLNFVILDACRNNPFARSVRSADRGLARMDAPAGVMIAYSTAPGEVAADGDNGDSPYTEALSQAMRESGLPAELMFKRARDAVRRMTAERQTPWESSSLTGANFYFASGPEPASTIPPPTSAPKAIPAPLAAADDGPPEFMADALCKNAVGEWRLNDEAMPGMVRLDANATGSARVRPDHHAESIPIEWECDAPNRKLIITFAGRDVHKVVMDWEQKLLFGYDKEGRPLTYTR
jgi:hypothetical protein